MKRGVGNTSLDFDMYSMETKNDLSAIFWPLKHV
jgi:hypothetical protein